MPPIKLHSGRLTENELTLVDGDLERVYRPRILVRSVNTQLRRALAAVDAIATEARRRTGVEDGAAVQLTDDEAERRLRLMCDAINLLFETSNEDAPQPGETLWEGWQADRVADLQILDLFGQVTGLGGALPS